ncbi:uncharacterized protein LOC106669595 [Cimex lectularius]|uniref:Uncharacterized protein n=1 Tax=Cimex lectularius TaxID=79782 RepID=A0A8I6S2A8_CIMLE|nr:uncharacterized protein LOC106669595 [Cimex lectularius]XP_014254660.1 uncharacterized protein LOC106669595 [Cimex lectularius]
MGNNGCACCIVLILLTTVSIGARRQEKQIYNGCVKDVEERCELEDEVEISKQKLRILLRGLVTLLVNLFPDCLPKTEQKQDEGVKVFRQIIACPPYPLMQPMHLNS